jgi:hypothetical protein
VTEADTGALLRADERERQVLFDLSGAFNATSEEMTAAKFVYDYDSTQPIAGLWGNPPLSLAPSSRVVAATNGVLFLTSGRLASPPGHLHSPAALAAPDQLRANCY